MSKLCAGSEQELRQLCKASSRTVPGGFANLDWAKEREAIDKASVTLDSDAYGAAVMRHRFCLVAPGDYQTTPKTNEYILAAAQGGCVPVLVVPDCTSCRHARRGLKSSDVEDRWRALPAAVRGTSEAGFTAARLASLETHAAFIFPFARHSRLDYCKMAYVVPQSRAVANMSAVLSMLERVSNREAAIKRAECARAAPALKYRADDPVAGAGAVTHLLSELCGAARKARAASAAAARGIAAPRLTPSETPRFDESCLLAP